MNKYYPYELHTHTLHSDGSFSVEELFSAAKDRGLHGIAMTDHNTISGITEGRVRAKETGLTLIEGIEWTTFFGHLTVLGGAYADVDWRDMSMNSADETIKKAVDGGSVVIVAHPKRFGSPYCTGCYFDYKLGDWKNVHAMEVWSEYNPAANPTNQVALKFYDELLNAGERIGVVYGNDWHRLDKKLPVYAMTFVAGSTAEQAMEAIKLQRTYISVGLSLSAKLDGKELDFGSEIRSDSYKLSLKVAEFSEEYSKLYGLKADSFGIINNGRRKYTGRLDTSAECKIHLEKGWFRLELYGNIRGANNSILLITSPVYVIE